MKKLIRILSACLAFALCFSLAVSVFAYNFQLRGTVTLPANKNSVTSKAYGGTCAKGTLYNNSGSAGNASLTLKYSSGTEWVNLQTVIAAPGASASTSPWGRLGYDYLFKITVSSSPIVLIGNPGRIATGYIYTE